MQYTSAQANKLLNKKWTTWSVAEMMNRVRFQMVRNEIAELCDSFPER